MAAETTRLGEDVCFYPHQFIEQHGTSESDSHMYSQPLHPTQELQILTLL